MTEVFSWTEGTLYVWSGAATASGTPVAYVTNASISPQWQWSNDARLDGSYRHVLQGRRANISLALGYTVGMNLVVLAQGNASVHFKFDQNGVNGSAGWLAYTGRINTLGLQGAEGGTYALSVAGYCNEWSAY